MDGDRTRRAHLPSGTTSHRLFGALSAEGFGVLRIAASVPERQDPAPPTQGATRGACGGRRALDSAGFAGQDGGR